MEHPDKEEDGRWEKWIVATLVATVLILAGIGIFMIVVDPFFHFHKPLDSLAYTLDNERYQNDGISRHFDYDSIITGTSMIENVKPSFLNELFGGDFIKISYGGGSLKEVDESLKRAIGYQPDIKTVIREIDKSYLLCDKDDWNEDAATPTYLWDSDPFNDLEYILNKDIIFGYALWTVRNAKAGNHSMTMDEYMYWADKQEWGKDIVLSKIAYAPYKEDLPFTDKDRIMVEENLEQNILATIRNNPDITFYIFSPPHSITWWNTEITGKGEFTRFMTALRMMSDELLEFDNVLLYGFDTEYDLVCDLDKYMDVLHYSEDVGDTIMEYMAAGEHLLTKDNIDAYFNEITEFYGNYDYASIYE